MKIQGVEGVSGSTSFVKGIDYSFESLGDVVTSSLTGRDYFLTDVDLREGSERITVSGWLDGKYVSLDGYAPSYSISVTGKWIDYLYTSTTETITYAKAVSSATGAINSQYGIIQSIS